MRCFNPEEGQSSRLYEGVLLPDGELMKVVENDGYKYLGIFDVKCMGNEWELCIL